MSVNRHGNENILCIKETHCTLLKTHSFTYSDVKMEATLNMVQKMDIGNSKDVNYEGQTFIVSFQVQREVISAFISRQALQGRAYVRSCSLSPSSWFLAVQRS